MRTPYFVYMDGMKLYGLQLNVDMPNSVPFLNRIPIFGVIPKTNTKKYMCLKEIGLHPWNMIIILNSIINTYGRTYVAI